MAANNVKTSLGSMESLTKVFNKFDANGDGKITKTELKSLLESLCSHASPDELDTMMAAMDADGDGAVDLAEFAAFHSSAPAETAEVKDAFDMFDKNGDGVISARELHDVMRSLGESFTVEQCEGMIKNVDVDGDGCVSFDEFKKMMKL